MSLTDKQLAQLLQDEELAKQSDQQLNTNAYASVSKPFPIPRDPFQAAIYKVTGMVSDNEATHLAGKYGLTINNVVWEDTARTKFSSVGPNISDVTLQVDEHKMPIIRSPNYTDLTWDVPLEKIPIVVGNEVELSCAQLLLVQILSIAKKSPSHEKVKKVFILCSGLFPIARISLNCCQGTVEYFEKIWIHRCLY